MIRTAHGSPHGSLMLGMCVDVDQHLVIEPANRTPRNRLLLEA
jgi:hypothetical protein